MRMKDPERPGKIIPVIPTMPQKKTKNKLSFSLAGEINVKRIATVIPRISEIMLD